MPRQDIESDPAEQEIYLRWRALTLLFLMYAFGEHLKSVLEHADETQRLHLHFYVVPALLPRRSPQHSRHSSRRCA